MPVPSDRLLWASTQPLHRYPLGAREWMGKHPHPSGSEPLSWKEARFTEGSSLSWKPDPPTLLLGAHRKFSMNSLSHPLVVILCSPPPPPPQPHMPGGSGQKLKDASYLRTRRASSLVMTVSVMPRPHLIGEQPGERSQRERSSHDKACGRPSPGTMGFCGMRAPR